MQIFTVIIIWITNSFKWFSFLVGASLILYLFNKEKNENSNIFTRKHIIEALLIIQPIAVGATFTHLVLTPKD